MPVIQGNTAGSIASTAKQIASTIKSYSLVNKSGGSITVSVLIQKTGISTTYVMTKTLALNESYTNNDEIKLLSDYYIIITTSGSVDYYFSIQ